MLHSFYRIGFLPSLAYNVILNKLNIREWYSRIDDKIILGALPWKSLRDELVEGKNIRGVVSMNENFELLLLKPWVMSGDDWAQCGVKFLQLPTQDIFETPSQDMLKQGVDFIMSFVPKHNELVYVHCKAGRTRSATLVACYLIKRNNWTPEQAFDLMKSKRFQPDCLDRVMSMARHDGVGVKPHLKCVDVLGFDDELLQMVEGKVEGLLLLYPLGSAPDGEVDQEAKKRLYFMRQTIRNACATMAIVHLLANRCSDSDYEPDSSILRFIKESNQLEPEKKANKFESCQSIATAHEKASVEGQTEAPPASDSTEYHFISIIHDCKNIYEMDGRKHGPINHGPTRPETFLKDGVRVCQSFVTSDNPNFSVLAFVRV
ncbi:Phosphatidylglycerophosphatase and protein-tyrosine phosphatase 1 [Fragariocoptes setiger]|uniref:ubiquitinyl hydrolase 1 n=1 Tax=Fragariocoptes setiger TaxID=1670756 RepID=A0ABQ7S9Z4_9ACAR|nr:Phosphatidylglycerophosphatase and protein-tyrosine phosphatase 1 [Fragariocoptes setiger]